MLFTASFRLLFCNPVSKEGCDRKENATAKQKEYKSLVTYYTFYWQPNPIFL